MKIVVIGSTNTDMSMAVKRLPKAGETISEGCFHISAGGKGANQAVAVARLAVSSHMCTFIGKVGADLFGKETRARLKKEGLCAHILTDEVNASGTALILVDSKGQNVISVAPGANGTLSVADLQPFDKELRGAKVLLTQLETPLETVCWAIEEASASGVCVILNPAPARKLPHALYSCLNWITPNETEAEILTGIPVVDAASAARAAAVLQKRGVQQVLITLGAKGCWCSVGEKIYPAQKVKSVDAVGAGDTFNGAFAVALTEGKGVEEAIEFAQKASALAVTRRGAQPSIPFRRELV